jgi:hypothetical protein
MASEEARLVHAMKGAVVCGDVDRVRELLAQGCSADMDVNPGPYPRQLLAFAVEHLQQEVCEVLLEHGADPKGWPQHNCIPIREAAGACKQGVTEDTVAARIAMCELLLAHGADPNEIGSGSSETSLHLAMRCGRSEQQAINTLRVLVRHGGDPSYVPARAHDGYATPLETALRMGELEVVKFYFTECEQNPFQKNRVGRSLLQLCAGLRAAECREYVRDIQQLWRSNKVQAEVGGALERAGAAVAPAGRTKSFSPI